MQEIVESYLQLKTDLSLLIKKSGFKTNFIAEKIGIRPTTFSVKRQRANWSEKEVLGILKIIENQDLENIYMLEIMKSRKSDENISFEEGNKIMGW